MFPPLSPVDDKVGQIVKYKGQEWRIIADDSHSGMLRKEWDYILQNVVTSEKVKIMQKDLEVHVTS